MSRPVNPAGGIPTERIQSNAFLEKESFHRQAMFNVDASKPARMAIAARVREILEFDKVYPGESPIATDTPRGEFEANTQVVFFLMETGQQWRLTLMKDVEPIVDAFVEWWNRKHPPTEWHFSRMRIEEEEDEEKKDAMHDE